MALTTTAIILLAAEMLKMFSLKWSTLLKQLPSSAHTTSTLIKKTSCQWKLRQGLKCMWSIVTCCLIIPCIPLQNMEDATQMIQIKRALHQFSIALNNCLYRGTVIFLFRSFFSAVKTWHLSFPTNKTLNTKQNTKSNRCIVINTKHTTFISRRNNLDK